MSYNSVYDRIETNNKDPWNEVRMLHCSVHRHGTSSHSIHLHLLCEVFKKYSFLHIGLANRRHILHFLVVQQSNALSTPSIELENNPVVSSNCFTNYTVPSRQILITTDLVAYETSVGYYGDATIKKRVPISSKQGAFSSTTLPLSRVFALDSKQEKIP